MAGSMLAFVAIWLVLSIFRAPFEYRILVPLIAGAHSLVFWQAHKETAALPAQIAKADALIAELEAQKKAIEAIQNLSEQALEAADAKKTEYEAAIARAKEIVSRAENMIGGAA